MSTRAKILIKAAVTIGLLGFVFIRMDMSEFLQVLAAADWLLVGLASALYFCTVFFVTGRWSLILSNFSIRTPYVQLMRIYLIGYFFNMFMPSAIGGDFFRAYYLAKREQCGLSTALTTAALDRFSGLSAVLLIGLTSSLVHPVEVGGRSIAMIFLGLGIVFALALATLFSSTIHRHFARLLIRLGMVDLESKVQLVYDGLNRLRQDHLTLLLVMLLSVGVQLLVVVIMWVAALALDFDSPFHWFLIFIPMVNLATTIPLTISGVGLRESVYFLLFSQIGVPMEKAVSLSLLNLFVFAVTSLVGGIVYSLYKKEQEFSVPETT